MRWRLRLQCSGCHRLSQGFGIGGVFDQRLGAPGTAAQQGAQACLEFGEIERFDQIVIGTGVQPGDAVFSGIARGEDQHRQGGQALAQAAQHGQAVDQRQAEVEHHAVETLQGQQLQGLGAVGRGGDAVSRLRELGAERIAQQFVVFNNQQVGHVVSLAAPPGARTFRPLRADAPETRGPCPLGPGLRTR